MSQPWQPRYAKRHIGLYHYTDGGPLLRVHIVADSTRRVRKWNVGENQNVN